MSLPNRKCVATNRKETFLGGAVSKCYSKVSVTITLTMMCNEVTMPYKVKYRAELTRVNHSVPYHKTLATEMHKEEQMPIKEFRKILKQIPNQRRHLLPNNWVMLERGIKGRQRLYTVYSDTKREDGNIHMIHFFHDEHAIIYFAYHKWTANDMGKLFQMYIDSKNKN